MKRIILMAVFMAAAELMQACNVCACSSMGNSLGILPQFRSHFAGLRYTGRAYLSKHPGTYLSPEGRSIASDYHSTELWGRYSPYRRLQVFGFLPYNSYHRTESGKRESLQGPGDPSLLVNYVLLNTPDSSGRRLKQALLLGAGYKFGLAAYNGDREAGFQLGSGSYDALFNASYTLRLGSAGFLSEGFYRLNGENAQAYRYGSKFTGSARLFLFKTYKKTAFLPWVGYAIEQSGADLLRSKIQDYTGGKITYASLGCDVFAGKFQLGCNTQLPLSQNLGQGQITENWRLSLFLIYHISTAEKCK